MGSKSLQVVLLEHVDNLGGMGDIVQVKPGFARNFLIPQNKALRATKENIAFFEGQRKVLEQENDKKKAEAQKRAKNVEGLTVTLIRQASEAGQLFGSVNARDIADSVNDQSKETVERSAIKINQNFKTLGLFPVEVVLHPEVKVEVTVNIARTEEEAKIQEKTGKAVVADEQGDAAIESEQAKANAEDALAEVMDEDAFKAQQEREAQEAEAAAEDAAKAEAKSQARAEKKAEKAETEEAEVAETDETSEEPAEDAASDEAKDEEKA